MSDTESEEEIIDEEEENSEEEDELTLKEQVSGLEKSIIRTKKIIEVPHDERRTSNYITKTELVEIIGTRAALIEKGATAYTQIGDLKNPIHIAVKELLEGQNPQKIQRTIQETEREKIVEIWSVREMVANLENYTEIVPENIFQKIQDSISSLSFNNSKSDVPKTKKGGNESTVPPIIYWYNGTNREKYNFASPVLSKISGQSKITESENREEILITLVSRSEYEKLLIPNPKAQKKSGCYIEISNDYAQITRLLATVSAICDEDILIDIELKEDNSLALCALQVINYYYRDVEFSVLRFYENGEKLRILAKNKSKVHSFYTQSLMNLIGFPEVKSIFLSSDLMRV